MNCEEVVSLLHPYTDGELDLVRHLQIEQHLQGCASCREQGQHLQSLRAAIATPSLRYRAPESLRARLQAALPSVTPTLPAVRTRSMPPLQRATMAASILLLVGMSATMGMLLSHPGSSMDERLADSVVADHVRSIQVDHLTDVVSSDRHTVKPWFQGKLDFAPNVPDLSEQGYVLSGGRLDYLVDRPVAALVYLRRLHAINVFIRPAPSEEPKTVRTLTRQGFHLCQWQQSGMAYWAISDLNDEELNEFVRLFQAALPQATL
jgi:anti-sigma factor RsiW